jgi:Uncharacterised protein family (UPF0160)
MPENRKMVKIGTHSGSFHCDEALGCYLLKQTQQFSEGTVTRRCAAVAASSVAATNSGRASIASEVMVFGELMDVLHNMGVLCSLALGGLV